MSKIQTLYLEMQVSNAKHTSYYYQHALGFKLIAFGDSSTGLEDKVSFVLKQNRICIVITSSTNPESNDYALTCKYGDWVKDIAFFIRDNFEKFYDHLVENNARFIKHKHKYRFQGNMLDCCIVRGYNDIQHTIYSNDYLDIDTILPPGYIPLTSLESSNSVGLSEIDHVAFCVPSGCMQKLVHIYTKLFGFCEKRAEEKIYSDNHSSGMKTLVIESRDGAVKFPLVEPLNERSPLSTFLTYYDSGGVHHVAYSTDNIIQVVKTTIQNGAEYMSAPSAYYEAIQRKYQIPYLDLLKTSNILVEIESHDSCLMQIFSKPLQPFATFFFEIIERRNNFGFGSGNIKALYDSIDLTRTNDV